MARQQRRRGLGLIELLVVGLVLALLGAMALPVWRDWLQQRRLLGASAELVSDLHYLQSEALRRDADLRISFMQTTGGSCYLLHSGDAGRCSCNEQGTAHCLAPAQVIKLTFRPNAENLRIESNSASMLYSVRSATFTPTATIRIRVNGGPVLQHRVNLRGRVRTCAEGEVRLGHAAC